MKYSISQPDPCTMTPVIQYNREIGLHLSSVLNEGATMDTITMITGGLASPIDE